MIVLNINVVQLMYGCKIVFDVWYGYKLTRLGSWNGEINENVGLWWYNDLFDKIVLQMSVILISCVV